MRFPPSRFLLLVTLGIVFVVASCSKRSSSTQELVGQLVIECNLEADQIAVLADTSYDDFRILDAELTNPIYPLNLKFKFQFDGKYYRWREVRIETLPWITKADFMKILSAAQTGDKAYEIIREWIKSRE